MPCMISRRVSTTSFSSLKGGMPKVSSPPMRGWRSNTTGCHAVAHQDVRAAKSRRSCADHRHALARGAHVRHVGTPAALERLVGDVLLDGADGDRAQAVVEGAGALAQAILRADAPAHLRQRVGLVRQLRGLEQVALLDQLQPVRDVVVDRALPLAERVAAGEAAARLLRGLLGLVGRVDLAEVRDARLDRASWRARRAGCRETAGSCRACRQAARRRFSMSESMEAALGFTTQNLAGRCAGRP